MLGDEKIKIGIFLKDSVSPMIFVLGMILNKILQKIKLEYDPDLAKGKGKLNYLVFMAELKLYTKTEAELDSLVQALQILSNDIKKECGLLKCVIMVMKREKLARAEGILLSSCEIMKAIHFNPAINT